MDIIKEIKLFFFLFLLFVFLNSDFFVQSVIGNLFENTIEGYCLNNKGTIIQSLIGTTIIMMFILPFLNYDYI